MTVRKILTCITVILILFNHSVFAETAPIETGNREQEETMEKLSAYDLLEQHENGTLNDMDFLRALGEWPTA